MDFQSRDEEICRAAFFCGWPESLRNTIFPLAAKPCVAGSICACRSYCVKLKALRSSPHSGSAESRQSNKSFKFRVLRGSFEFRVSSFKFRSAVFIRCLWAALPLPAQFRHNGCIDKEICSKLETRNLKLFSETRNSKLLFIFFPPLPHDFVHYYP